ncbi:MULTISPECIES: hypothetical protein [Carnobacterium]|uniref:hypothetical protein n=1 Tax=Carnobacterium TaxID=2747 RepID=UPI001E1070B6|nr:hypothetical protein [Carnobacterium maltaromaticum]MCC4313458.1 hypothetical protein [Carnobacterium maltaromaticum]
MAKITKAELSKKKAVAQLFLQTKDIDIDDWLADKYQEVVDDNPDTLSEALNLFINHKKNGNKPTPNSNLNGTQTH